MFKNLTSNKSLLIICFLTLFTFASSASASETRDPGKFFLDQTFGNMKEELANAKEQGKKGILIFFSLQDCPFCFRMLTTVMNQKSIQEQYKKDFLIFEVDIEGETEMVNFNGDTILAKDFAFQKHRVRATPVFLFFDLEGKPVARYTGATSGVEEFRLLGKYVADGVYKEKPFRKYKRENLKK